MPQIKNNSGVLFRNTKKKSNKSPEYTGSVMINGVDMWISGWVKESTKQKDKDGKPTRYFSLAFRPKTASEGGEP